jgi:5-methylcytosine-specific restriction endonuclease McrA
MTRLFGADNPAWKGRTLTRRCHTCQGDFSIAAAKVDLGEGKYCSLACLQVEYRRRRVTSVCRPCGRTITAARSKRRIYCSVRCRNAGYRRGSRMVACGVCRASFEVPRRRFRRGTVVKYCSIVCRETGKRRYPTNAIRRQEERRRREAILRAGRKVATHTRAEWLALVERFEGRCAGCGASERLTRDHVVPLSRGGDDGIANIQPLCLSCNSRKGAR